MISKLEEKENANFLNSSNAGLLKTTIGRLRMHTALVYLQDLADSQVSTYEQNAMAKAKEALSIDRPITLPPLPTDLHLTGTRLSKITQAIAYKTIQSLKHVPQRPRTCSMLSHIKMIIAKVNKKIPSEKQIWLSFRIKDFPMPIKVFLWKCTHDAYKVGSYWNRPSMKPELAARGVCEHDNSEDSLNHILTECTSNRQAIIWEMVSNIWRRRTGEHLPKQDIFSILGSPLMIKQEDGRKSPGLS